MTAPRFNLDTGYQFRETLELRHRIAEKYGIVVDLQKPELSVEAYEAAHGGPIHQSNPDRCCFDRKVAVLHRVAKNYDAWATGVRRDQSPTRADTPIVRWDKKFGLMKISPLATWTKGDVWKRIFKENIPYNPLHDRGYPSIGCWPCTRSVTPGEDEAREDGRGRRKPSAVCTPRASSRSSSGCLDTSGYAFRLAAVSCGTGSQDQRGRSAAKAADLPGGIPGPVAGGVRSHGAVGADRGRRLPRRGPAAARAADGPSGLPGPDPRPRRHRAGLRSDRGSRGGQLSLAPRSAR